MSSNSKRIARRVRMGKPSSDGPRIVRSSGQPRPTADSSSDAQTFQVTLRGLHQRAKDGATFERDDPVSVIKQILAADVSGIDEPTVTWTDLLGVTALDFDKPDDACGIAQTEIATFFPPTLPVPLAAWITHGGGLRALFVETDDVPATALAGAWALLAPLGPVAASSARFAIRVT